VVNNIEVIRRDEDLNEEAVETKNDNEARIRNKLVQAT